MFERAVAGAQIELLHTPFQAPRANALCERFIGSVRRECLDHVLLFSEGHARRVIREYVAFFNNSRPHQGLDQQIPDPPSVPPLAEPVRRQVIGLPILHGLHHDYQWAA
jgi:putative transposase